MPIMIGGIAQVRVGGFKDRIVYVDDEEHDGSRIIYMGPPIAGPAYSVRYSALRPVTEKILSDRRRKLENALRASVDETVFRDPRDVALDGLEYALIVSKQGQHAVEP